MSPLADDDITWLLGLLESEDLLEIEVESLEEGWRVRASRVPPDIPAPDAPATPALQHADAEQLPDDVVPVLAAMSGIFYRSPSPDAPPYVEEGDKVERGQVVGLIEAMKIFNEIESPVNGVVVRILVDNQQQVEADQRLMLVKVTH